MNFNRQEFLNLQNRILARPKRLASVYVPPTFEDIGVLVELPENKLPQFPNLRSQNAVRTQLKKYKNLYLYDKKLFRNRRESRDLRENQENIHSSKQSAKSQWQDEMKITKLLIMKSEVLKSKTPDITRSVSNTQKLQLRKPSHLNVEPYQYKDVIVLPSIRGWDNNHQHSQMSN